MSETRPKNFSELEDWNRWLRENHSKQNHIWVVIQKKNSKKKGIRYEEALDEAMCFGWIDSKMKRLDEDQFIQRFSPRRKNSLWSLRNKNKALKLIKGGRMTEAGFKAVNEAKKNGRWLQAYTSSGPTLIPDDLLEALKTSLEAFNNFMNFPESARFMYIHWINNAKRVDTRTRRIKRVVERSEKNLKPGIDV